MVQEEGKEKDEMVEGSKMRRDKEIQRSEYRIVL